METDPVNIISFALVLCVLLFVCSSELSNMKTQDENMSGQVAEAQEELCKALEQSQRDSE